MTVRELIEQLQKENQDAVVVSSVYVAMCSEPSDWSDVELDRVDHIPWYGDDHDVLHFEGKPAVRIQ